MIFLGLFLTGAGHGIDPVEGVMAQQTSRAPRRKPWPARCLYTLIVIAILGGLNFLANRYNKSYDTTSNKKFTLSDQTEKIAKNLKQDVTITYWDQPTGFTDAHDLLDRYKNLSPKIDVRYKDADKKRTQAIAAGVKNPSPPSSSRSAIRRRKPRA